MTTDCQPQIKIDSELRNALPPPSDEQIATLEANLLRDGCRDALVVWKEKDILLDGHHRYAICRKHGLPYKVKSINLPDKAAAIMWVRMYHLGRRNFLPDVERVLRGEAYNRQKKANGGDRKSSGQNVHLNGKTAEQQAEQKGVSEKTVRRDAALPPVVATTETSINTHNAARGQTRKPLKTRHFPQFRPVPEKFLLF